MEFRHLRYFVVLAEKLNFHKASEELNITAPTLSVQIRQLEEEVGCKLLARNTVCVRLTAEGEFFLRKAKRLVAAMEEMRASMKTPEKEALRIGNPMSFGYTCYSFIPEVVALYQTRFPGAPVEFEDVGLSELQGAALEENRIQIGFVYGSQIGALKDVEHFTMLDTVLNAFMRAGHPLTELERVPLTELAKHEVVGLATTERHTRVMADLFRKAGAGSVEFRKVSGHMALLSALATSDAVTLLPRTQFWMQFSKLTGRPITPKWTPVRLHAVWKKERVTPTMRNFIAYLKELGTANDGDA
jgi:DNA-binding transcriptional LysR family regulator